MVNCSHKIKKMLAAWKGIYDKPRQHIKKQRYYFVNKGLYSQSSGFSSSHVWMGELDYKEGWAPKSWCFQVVVLEKTLESPLDRKELKLANSKGNQPWIFIERTDAEATILWPPDGKSQLTGKDPDAGKDWGQEEKEMTEDEMVGGHHWFNGLEFEQALGDSEGQGRLYGTVRGVENSWAGLSNWTTKTICIGSKCKSKCPYERQKRHR